MKHKRFVVGSCLLLFGGLLLSQCKNSTTDTHNESSTSGPSAAQQITPVELKIVTAGFHFPEDSNVVYKWINTPYDSGSVYTHAWGIWAGLTVQSGEIVNGDSLRVYETWAGVEDVQQQIIDSVNGEKTFRRKKHRTILRVPNQFIHAGLVNGNKLEATGTGLIGPHLTEKMRVRSAQVLTDTAPKFVVAVSYNPAAVQHVVSHRLLDSSVLASYGKSGTIGTIPAFPSNAITLKPTYFIGHAADTFIRVAVWPPAKGLNPPDSFPYSSWNQYVYVDILNRQMSGKHLSPVSGNSGPTAASTCNLSDFIHFRIDSLMAQEMKGSGVGPVTVGDFALLVAMHVGTKEISNWTWQSFFWSPTPDNPGEPSSALAAGLRRKLGVTGAAAHYAVTTAYTMVLPNQPISGGTNSRVKAMIGYNPYLEAVFGPSTFPTTPNPLNPQFKYGIQTNCMSCHSQATADGNLSYNTDQYIDMNDKAFVNRVQLDFAWSIVGNIIPDSLLHKNAKSARK